MLDLGGERMNTVEPIRDINTVMDIADYLKSRSERNYVMFMFGIYTGLRISDILKFRVRDVKGKDAIYLREKKTGKEKRFPLNAELKPIIEDYISDKKDYEYLFKSCRSGNKAISRQQAYKILSAGSSTLIRWERIHSEKHSGIICTNRHTTQSL
mgnify:CR=1 FL=1